MVFALVEFDLGIISDRLIDQTVWMVLELFEDFLSNLFLPVDEVVVDTVVIVPHLPIHVINLNQLSQIHFIVVLRLVQ